MLVNNASGGPADAAGALEWRQGNGLVNVHVFGDNNYSLIPTSLSQFGTPFLTVIDPTTMQIAHWHQGYIQGANYVEAEAIARANAGL